MGRSFPSFLPSFFSFSVFNVTLFLSLTGHTSTLLKHPRAVFLQGMGEGRGGSLVCVRAHGEPEPWAEKNRIKLTKAHMEATGIKYRLTTCAYI